jgi:hypothetical protein
LIELCSLIICRAVRIRLVEKGLKHTMIPKLMKFCLPLLADDTSLPETDYPSMAPAATATAAEHSTRRELLSYHN